MLKDFMQRFDALQQGGAFAVPVEVDEKGYYDRECPVVECRFQFKVNAEDWREKFNDEAVYCPMCGHASASNKFWTTEQVEQAAAQVRKRIVAEFRNAIRSEIESWNDRMGRSGWIKISLSGGAKEPLPTMLPIGAAEVFHQELTCLKCSSRFSVIGSAFFCPCCGHNCVDTTLDNSLKKIETKIRYIPDVYAALSETSKDDAEVFVRSLRETCLNDCVVAFQRFCEESYKRLAPPDEKIKRNAFQNLVIGCEYWQSKFGEDYQTWLAPAAFQRMNVLFNRRHLLSHTEGIVDEGYITKSGDATYNVGQRIVVRDEDVMELLDYIKTIVAVVRLKMGL
ncbi:MAG: hypothetical protein EON97_00115 [Chitinophagaceae bacterium]|nr:MAG: hypothetical protein EON97_00115 [Chitinophagaceae bacterium]